MFHRIILSFALACTSQVVAQEKTSPVLTGWQGIFPEYANYARKFEAPKVTKDAYEQTARYDWSGGRLETITITLTRDAEKAKMYTPDGIKTINAAAKSIKIADRQAWLWQSRRLVIGADRFVTIAAPTYDKFASDLPEFAKKLDLDKCAKALDQPPRTDFRRTVEMFRGLRKDMSLTQVREWVGESEKDIGSGIHILTYRLEDGSRVLIGFPDFNRLIYVKHEDKNRTVVDLVK